MKTPEETPSQITDEVPIVFDITIDELDSGHSNYDHALAVVHITLNRRAAKFLAAVIYYGCNWSSSGYIGDCMEKLYEALQKAFQFPSEPNKLLEDQPYISHAGSWYWNGTKWHKKDVRQGYHLGGPYDDSDEPDTD